MFEPVTRNIFRWGTLDGESGFMMYSHLLRKEDKAVLIDPVAKPGLIEMIKVLSEPVAVIMTNHVHIRGCPLLSNQLNIPLFIPDIKTVDEDEKLVNTFIELYNMGGAIQYTESTALPLGIRAYSISGRHEMALKFDEFLIVGDSAYGIDGKLSFYPTGFRDDESNLKSSATAAAVLPLIRKSNAQGLLSGHMEDISSGLQNMI